MQTTPIGQEFGQFNDPEDEDSRSPNFSFTTIHPLDSAALNAPRLPKEPEFKAKPALEQC